MSASYPTKLLLAFRNGDICAFPGCNRSLTANSPNGNDPVVIGEAAHIEGENASAARYNPNMTDDERDHFNNLIYLCGDHHTQIDKQEKDFPVVLLQQWKRDHEIKARQALNTGFATVGFAELEYATRWVLRVTPIAPSTDFTVIYPEDKILKNELTNQSRVTITMGLSVSREVQRFLDAESRIDSDYAQKLTAGFLERYFKLRHEGQRGDALFDLMCQFAQQGMTDQAKKSASLAVLVYLFESCEVFEK